MQVEKESSSWYVGACGTQSYRYHTVKYYYCNRSGFSKCKVVRKRGKKIQGSSKMKGTCCSFMTARKNKVSGSISVDYCLDHVGHNKKLAHVPLSDEMRTMIAGKLASGVSVTHILDHIRDNIVKLDRDSIVTRQDIVNIRRQYNVQNIEKDPSDVRSVDIWVNELRRNKDSDPIIIYKKQGEDSDEFGLN